MCFVLGPGLPVRQSARLIGDSAVSFTEHCVEGIEPIHENLKKNLHVSLCFSPVGAAFRQRASRFPSLINCAVIDWFQPWPGKK